MVFSYHKLSYLECLPIKTEVLGIKIYQKLHLDYTTTLILGQR